MKQIQLREYIFENGSYKLVALVITLILWITILNRRDVVVNRTVNIVFNVGANYVIANDVINQVEFRIAGSRIAVKRFAEAPVQPINIDLISVGPGKRLITIPEESLALPFGAKVTSILPSSLFVEIDEIQEKSASVRIALDPQLKSENLFEILSVLPEKVLIKGAGSTLSRIENIWTERLGMSALNSLNSGGNKDPIEIPLRLVEPHVPGIVSVSEKQVVVRLKKTTR